jgi:hypothetical protein
MLKIMLIVGIVHNPLKITFIIPDSEFSAVDILIFLHILSLIYDER